ncbi:MAG TPA: hypothetical protein VGV92_00785 [Gammaproteobacteria bacterium]|nr:hypothetical protein [Gammaproteobacteria bacterium]
METESAKRWVKGVNVFLGGLLGTALKLKAISNLAEIKRLLHEDGSEMKKNLPLIGMLLALLTAGFVISWATLFVIAVFLLQGVLKNWLEAIGVAGCVNLLAVFLIIRALNNVLGRMRFFNTREYLSRKKAVKPSVKN